MVGQYRFVGNSVAEFPHPTVLQKLRGRATLCLDGEERRQADGFRSSNAFCPGVGEVPAEGCVPAQAVIRVAGAAQGEAIPSRSGVVCEHRLRYNL